MQTLPKFDSQYLHDLFLQFKIFGGGWIARLQRREAMWLISSHNKE